MVIISGLDVRICSTRRRPRNFSEDIGFLLEDALHAEVIDRLELTPDQKSAQRADYFLLNRRLIIEKKSLDSSRQDLAQRLVDQYRRRPEWPRFFGRGSMPEARAASPLVEEFESHLAYEIATSAKRCLEKAEDQIRETRRTFNLPDARGILLLLNERTAGLDPNVLVGRLKPELRRRVVDGTPLYPSIDSILMMFSSHVFMDHRGGEHMFTILLTREQYSGPELECVLENIIPEGIGDYLQIPRAPRQIIRTQEAANSLPVFGPSLELNVRKLC